MPANQDLAAQFLARQSDAATELARLPLPGARTLPVVWGLTGQCTTDLDLENIFVEMTQVLVQSGRIYTLGNSVVMESGDGQDKRLLTLATGSVIESGAAELLANIFHCGFATKNGSPRVQPPTNRIVGTLLSREPTRERLPRISLYANRPVFDEEFTFCSPGWHPGSGVLVHGPQVAPCLPEQTLTTQASALRRLPPHLRALLGGFCFASDADLANAVSMMLTGLLMSHHTVTLHPLGLLDGNQPGVGKTLLARTIGMLLDGRDPRLINYTTNDEELCKRLLATIRDGNPSVVPIDNAKVRVGSVVSSPVLEANSVAPEISLRILGVSQNYVRPNDILWFLTMNDTKVSPDLVSRCVPIRFRYEGDPGQRTFGEDPVEYARKHRSQILGELAGMVLYWNQRGRKPADRPHRLRKWAEQIGGILEANGLPEFLTNLQQAANDFNTELDEVGALAEACLKAKQRWFSAADEGQIQRLVLEHGAKPSDWRVLLKSAGLMTDELEATKGTRGVAQKIGNFLSKHVNRPVTIDYQDPKLVATLRSADGRSREKLYCFEIAGEVSEGPGNGPPADTPNEATKPVPKPETANKQRAKRAQQQSLAAALSPGPLESAALIRPTLASKESSKATMTTNAVAGKTGNSESWA